MKLRLGIRTIPCIFGEEKNQVPLMCFVCVCLEERRKAQNSSRQRVGPKKSHFLFVYFYFLVWRVPRAFYSPDTDYEAVAPSGAAAFKWSWMGLILTSSF